MFIEISKIMYYGEYYTFSEMNNKNDITWWLSSIDYSVLSTEDLFDKYSYHSCEEVLEVGLFIPLFRTNIMELEKEFIQRYYPNHTKKIFKSELDIDNHITFMKFIESNFQEESFYSFRNERLAHDAVKWCHDNNLKYKE